MDAVWWLPLSPHVLADRVRSLAPSSVALRRVSDALYTALSGEFGAPAFWCPPGGVVPRVDARSLSPLDFHRRFVARNTPVVLTHLMDDVRVCSPFRVFPPCVITVCV